MPEKKAEKKSEIRLETAAYKGVRDFYPNDMYLEKFIFDRMRRTVESFGYVEYGASILEPTDLYRAKTGEEMVTEQSYTFTDRGDREVTLRPEMTPTVARMIAQKRRELSFPLRWYSIPNLFRYEQPQRGRLREHFQLNADLFGIDHVRADIEIVSIAYQLLKDFGAKDEDFEIQINSRDLLNQLWDTVGVPAAKRLKLLKVIDKKNKVPKETFDASVVALVGKKAPQIIEALDSGHSFMAAIGSETPASKRLVSIIDGLIKLGVNNVILTPTLVRGADYYTGFVFEIFDTSKENNRSIFGGGRYDNLLEIFGVDPVPAVGFGAGDVTLADFMRTHNLLPEYTSPTLIYIAAIDDQFEYADIIAEKLRDLGAYVAVDYTEKSIGDRIKKAVAEKIPYFFVIGKTEAEKGMVKIKDLDNRTEASSSLDENSLNKLVKVMYETKIKNRSQGA